MGSIRERTEESLARQQEWGTDNGPYLIGPNGTEDMREWDDEKWAGFEMVNGTATEEDMMSLMDMSLTRLKNYK